MAVTQPLPTPYHVYQALPGVRPPWHGGEFGKRWSQSLGLLKDAFAEGARQARRMRYVSTCPEDALALHGEACMLPRAPGESVDEYRARLAKRWHLWQWAGTRKGIVDAFALLGMTNVEVLETFTPGWGRNVGVKQRSRWFNIVVRHPHPFGTDFSFTYGDGTTWGEGKLWGVNGDPRLLELLRRLVRTFKPAHAHCEWIAIVLAGDIKHAGASTDGDPDTGAKVAYLKP